MKTFLAMAPFWDPYCPPLGITSLQAYLKERGRDVAIFDFNTSKEIWRAQRAYFDAFVDAVPAARHWNIMRVGPDYFARHQMAWLSLRDDPSAYRDLAARILNIDGRQRIDPRTLAAFDRIFEAIYARIDALLDEQLARHRPTVVGCTMLTTTLPASLHILKRAKAFDPEIRTVLGGPGPIMGAGADSPDTQRILDRCPYVDNVVIGEGEILMDALHAGLLERRRIYALRDVSTELAERAATPVHRNLIKDVGRLPTPDYTGLAVPHYTRLSVGVTRGCAYQCSFCYETTYWRRYRKRPIESALDDIEALSARHGRSSFFLCDSLANLFAEDLADGVLRRGLDTRWDAYLRADAPLTDPDYVRHLAAGGMVRARLGVESADQATLDLMNKRTSSDVMGEVIETLAEAGIETSTLWIVGFPNEDEAAFQASLDFLSDHRDAIFAADPWQFVFHPTTGDVPVFGRLTAADSFEARLGMHRIYPEEYDDALLVQYYELDIPDVMAVKLDRIARMGARMAEWGIPNPYSMAEWRAADRRWQALHPRRPRPTAVPQARPVAQERAGGQAG
ncbi:B12-binding domain-containing radical SAM protein [Methylobacterium nonmethylotrophicum]|uniref:Radical SAM protein n=1 Tax=Methylobacterium nonmethylotrophicum TaxID=1141884 RepID=A0A4Z0NQ90_9HYPH|nr:radical SAM protein [Methylobacterium nonmethylotrophicum]TGD98919.1 radical SAM protein [Methylobacterium nonmethylotrophicum]